MKKKGLSMNLIMALTLTAVAVSVLLCANLVFMQTYRRTLLRNAETTSRQAIAQASSTMNEYLEDMNDAVTLLTGYLDLPAEEREARFEAFLEIRAVSLVGGILPQALLAKRAQEAGGGLPGRHFKLGQVIALAAQVDFAHLGDFEAVEQRLAIVDVPERLPHLLAAGEEIAVVGH